nr:MAG TPA: hypothetical protein [Caudoviricetes sp.]DAU60075.1 MAG TPA: hypothetical protein [Caudoviricetes sp.]DAW44692.1 MAG TPA: hypothetical protein [Caudoviricetes sp.]DAY28834.1 MAG TPA: hypothetical protein [Caudoviricetes sp.]DAZ01685.1 MAG TPA: hypothetical protein [Caudoviricetes sp.]
MKRTIKLHRELEISFLPPFCLIPPCRYPDTSYV